MYHSETWWRTRGQDAKAKATRKACNRRGQYADLDQVQLAPSLARIDRYTAWVGDVGHDGRRGVFHPERNRRRVRAMRCQSRARRMCCQSVRGEPMCCQAVRANPCAANPCAANPCAANPCAANPCAANPCARVASAGARQDVSFPVCRSFCQPCAANPVRRQPLRRQPVRRVDLGNPCAAKSLRCQPVRRQPVRRQPVRCQSVRCEPLCGEPCAANPCAANPCAANPCAANPCAANPCAAAAAPPTGEDELQALYACLIDTLTDSICDAGAEAAQCKLAGL